MSCGGMWRLNLKNRLGNRKCGKLSWTLFLFLDSLFLLLFLLCLSSSVRIRTFTNHHVRVYLSSTVRCSIATLRARNTPE